VQLDPGYADAYLSLGHAYFDLGKWKQAIDNQQRGVALKPKDKESKDRLTHARLMLELELEGREAKSSDGKTAGDKTRPASPPLSSASESTATARLSPDDLALTKIYRVGPGDVLDVRLTGPASTSAQSNRFTVTAAGLLEHPDLSAPLHVGGLTVEEISARIEDDLKRKSPANNHTLSVAVEEYASHSILVSGLVKEPGAKILKREAIPLYVVVADAQALPEAGRISVLRNESNESYLFDLLDHAEMNLMVRPGDVITLEPNSIEFFYVGGDVKSPGEKIFRRGLTLTQVIIAAGGLTRNAKEARLGRDNGKGFLVVNRYKLKDIDSGKVPDPMIQPGDRITID
jgi:protein involved in polysaccharide export with SLBB domain